MWTAGVLMAGAAAAFSSEDWLEKRADDSDMLRLRMAFAECSQKAVAPAENVSMVLEMHPDGTVKTRIRAARAMIFPDQGYVWAENIHLEGFAVGGTNITLRLDADNCLFDRTTNAGWVDGNASIMWGETTAKGRGVYFSLPSREKGEKDEKRESRAPRNLHDFIKFVKIFSQSEFHMKGDKSNNEVG